MSDLPATLDGLRDLHASAGANPTMALAALLLGAAAAVLLLLLVGRLRARRGVARRAALAELAAASRLAPADRLVAQALLLRRLAAAREGAAAQNLRGEAWLATLDRVFATRFFETGPGRRFGDDLYQRPSPRETAAIDDELARLLTRWRLA